MVTKKPRRRSPRLLLVGAEPMQVRTLATKCGFDVVATDKGEKGLFELQEQSFDIVIIGLEILDMESHDFLDGVMATDPEVSVALLASPAKAHLIVSTMVRGVDFLIPFPPPQAELHRLLKRHRSSARQRRKRTDVRGSRSSIRDTLSGPAKARTVPTEDDTPKKKAKEKARIRNPAIRKRSKPSSEAKPSTEPKSNAEKSSDGFDVSAESNIDPLHTDPTNIIPSGSQSSETRQIRSSPGPTSSSKTNTPVKFIEANSKPRLSLSDEETDLDADGSSESL